MQSTLERRQLLAPPVEPVWQHFTGIDARWTSLLMKAHQEECHAVGGSYCRDPRTGVVRITCRVTSGTAEGVIYNAQYIADSDGVRVACDCKAGFHAIPCKHIAYTLESCHEFEPPKQAKPVPASAGSALALLNDEEGA